MMAVLSNRPRNTTVLFSWSLRANMAEKPYKDEEWLRERWFSDMSVVAIADEVGCSDHAINYWAKKFGFTPKDKIVTENTRYRDEEWLRERWFSGMTTEEIAEETNAVRSTIEGWAEKHGFPPKEQSRPWFDGGKIAHMYEREGMSIHEISEHFECSASAIQATMIRENITRRSYSASGALRTAGQVGYHTAHNGYEMFHGEAGGEAYNILHHRLIAVAMHGFEEVREKVVHHKNSIPWDNRHENIELYDSQSDHAKHHNEKRDRDEQGRYV